MVDICALGRGALVRATHQPEQRALEELIAIGIGGQGVVGIDELIATGGLVEHRRELCHPLGRDVLVEREWRCLFVALLVHHVEAQAQAAQQGHTGWMKFAIDDLSIDKNGIDPEPSGSGDTWIFH